MIPAIDDRLTIDPPPFAIMAGIAYFMPKNTPVALKRIAPKVVIQNSVAKRRSASSR